MKKLIAMFVAGVIAGAVVVGGVGVVSAVTGTDTPIVACADKKTGAMRYSAKGKCKKSENKLSLQAPISLAASQVAGPKGDSGATGAAGAKGDTGSTGPQGATGPAGTGLNTVPVSFGSKTLIQKETAGCCDFGNNNLYIHAIMRNRTDRALDFDGENNYQLWIKYFDAEGTEIECGYGCTYSPGGVGQPSAPCGNIAPGAEITYELTVSNVHAQAPDNARYFALYFRPSPDTGPLMPNFDLPLTGFTATPTEAIINTGSISNDLVTSMVC